jgi:hypothetical protein
MIDTHAMTTRSRLLLLLTGICLMWLAACADPYADAEPLLAFAAQAVAPPAAFGAGDETPSGGARAGDPADRPAPAGQGASSGREVAESVVADAPLEPFREELLDLAFEVASSLPLEPHVKTRSRAQDDLVATCLALDLPRRALRYADGIRNWRRGSCYADVALYLVRRGETAGVQACLDLAERVARAPADPDEQAWRRDRILAKLAAAYVLLDLDERAAGLSAGLVPSEEARVVEARAVAGGAEAVDVHVAMLADAVKAGTFDLVRHALDACAQLIDAQYDDEPLRARLEAAVRDTWRKMPRTVSLELQFRLAHGALDHDDPATARAWIAEAEGAMEGVPFRAETGVPLDARLAGLLHRAGETARARALADEALATFGRETETIADVFRGEVLRPLAETYRDMGDDEMALRVYRLAVEHGALNPNSRPRAEDLAATCGSLARSGLQPDAALHARLLAIRDGLGDPW